MQQNLLIILVVIWLGLSVGSALLFQRKGDVTRKKKLWPIYNIFGNVVLGIFLIIMQPPLPMLISLLVLMVPLTYMTIRSTRFCDACGSPTRKPFFMKPPTECGHCGKKLNY